MFISFNPPLGPPRVGSRVIPFPSCHTNGRQLPPLVGSPNALKPQKSSPLGSAVEVWTTPTACPQTFPPKAMLLVVPCRYERPMSKLVLLSQSAACMTPLCA